MRKNIRKSVVALLASLMMVPALTACSSNDITTSEGNNQTETKKAQFGNQERKNSKQNNSFIYYSMPSVLKVTSLANSKAFSGVSGIAVDPDTRAEYYFAIVAGNDDNKPGIVTITPRKTSKGIVSYRDDLNNLKTFNIHQD